MSVPTKCRSFTARTSSSAQASGRCIGSAAKPAKRSGWRAMAVARWSFISLAMATPSVPGTRSGPGPLFESTCTVMPASSIDFSRRSPISGRSSSGFGPFAGTFLGRKPRRLIAPGSIRRTMAGTVKCSSSATTRIGDFLRLLYKVAASISDLQQAGPAGRFTCQAGGQRPHQVQGESATGCVQDAPRSAAAVTVPHREQAPADRHTARMLRSCFSMMRWR